MASRAQQEQRHADRDLFQRAARAVRVHAGQQRADHVAGEGPPVPPSVWPQIGVLEALARAAGNGDLPADLLREARDWATTLDDGPST